MKVEIKIPEVAEGVTVGTVVALSVAVGDEVTPDQTVLELETDKAVVAIPTEQAGTITDILVAEGDKVEVGSTVMILGAEGGGATAPEKESEEKDEDQDSPAQTISQTEVADAPSHDAQEPATRPEPAIEPLEVVPQEPPSVLKSQPGEQHVAAAAPSVRRLARELGVDIHKVQGTGTRGRISADDVNEYVKSTMLRVSGGSFQGAEFPGLHAQRPLPDFSRFGSARREPLSRVRELTADAMGYAWSTIPMVTQYDKASISPLENFRKEFNQSVDASEKLTMTAFLVKVCAAALKEFPQFNSALDLASKELVLLEYINVGVAVDTPKGLLVPVLREAQSKGVQSIARELNTLAVKTRERKVTPDELEGGTFTISNLGGIGGTAFTPIVYAPQVAILGVASAEMQPVWNGSDFAPQLMMPLCLTYDHRVIDGADGARFLRWICRALENPWQMVM